MARKDLIQHRRDTAANWTSVNPVLAASELGFETDTNKFKLGDGTSTWTALAYQGGGGSGVSLTPSATQTIVAQNATTTPLVVKSAATPSVNIFDVQNSAGTSQAKVTSAGVFTAPTATIPTGLDVGGNQTTANKTGFIVRSNDNGTSTYYNLAEFYGPTGSLSSYVSAYGTWVGAIQSTFVNTQRVNFQTNTTGFAPIILPPTALISSAQAGAIEFDGNNFYSSLQGTYNRGIMPSVLEQANSAVISLANSTAVQTIFQFAPAAVTYEFEGVIYLATGTTLHNVSLSFEVGGGATISSIAWESEAVNVAGGGSTPTAPVKNWASVATAIPVITSSISAGKMFKVSGIVRFSAGGKFTTFAPSLTFSAAPGGTNQVLANSFFKMTQLGSLTFTATA